MHNQSINQSINHWLLLVSCYRQTQWRPCPLPNLIISHSLLIKTPSVYNNGWSSTSTTTKECKSGMEKVAKDRPVATALSI